MGEIKTPLVIFLVVLFTIGLMGVSSLIPGFAIWLGWNWVVVPLASTVPMTFLQAYIIGFLFIVIGSVFK